MAKLNHPCVCALYQTMQRSDNVYYLVTELAAGGDLCTFVKEQRDGKLEERPTRIYARQFASALGHMHHMGVSAIFERTFSKNILVVFCVSNR